MFEKLKDGEFCPLIQKACVTHKCKWYKKIIGLNPQTGAQIEEYDCAIGMLPILLIENAAVGRQVSAEINEVKKETAKQKYIILNDAIAESSSAFNRLLPRPSTANDGESRGPNGSADRG